ncbi:MAG: hypothetical protein AB7U83_20355 [Vicinamibacterales bacterium]
MTRSFWIGLSLGAFLLGALPVAADAQSLAAVARREEARRKDLPSSSKVYTNQDLRRDPTTPMPPPPAAADTAAPTGTHGAGSGAPAASPAPAEAPPADAAGGPARDQKYWQDRISGARAELERSRTFADALQSRIAALTTDFVNRDDPAQRAVIEQNRLKAVAELERVQREIAAHAKTISGIEDEARRAGVPAGWLR